MKQSYIIPGILSVISCIWLFMSVTVYGIWDEGPLGGFMPTLAAVITLGFSLAALITHRAESKQTHRTVFIPVLLVAALILLTSLFGMRPCMFVLLLSWFHFLEKYPWRFSVLMSVCILACVWLIFSLWLSVPFPAGWIMDKLV